MQRRFCLSFGSSRLADTNFLYDNTRNNLYSSHFRCHIINSF